MMLEANPITKQVLDFQKGAFSRWHGAMSILQKQGALTMGSILNQAIWIPDEGRQAILSWVSAWQNEGNRFITYVEESFSGIEGESPFGFGSQPVTPRSSLIGH
jgi:hypothetical protein